MNEKLNMKHDAVNFAELSKSMWDDIKKNSDKFFDHFRQHAEELMK